MNAKSKRKRGQINFPGLSQNRTVYETISIPLPVYVTLTYDITIRTEYQQQMNELITAFIVNPGGVNYILLEDKSITDTKGLFSLIIRLTTILETSQTKKESLRHQ